MRLLFANHIGNAYQSLRSNRLRSGLTILGITIGVASITTILALSGGASKIVTDQIDELGGNIAVIGPGAPSKTPLNDLAQIPSQQQFTASTITEVDLAYIRTIDHISAIAPLMILTGAVQGDEEAPANTPIVATDPDLADISQLKTQEGQFLDEKLNENTAVIGPQLSINIFGTEMSIGKTAHIRGKPFTVIGVLKRTNNPINYNGVDFDNAIIINQRSGHILNRGVAQIQQINIRSDSIATLDQVIVEVNKALLTTHHNQVDFTVLSGEQIAQPTNQMFYAIAGATTAIAAISLIVGGIGVMNIMLVSVAERTREIGIRKALGASNGDIVSQFLIESLALSIAGGVSGYLFGYALAFLISTFMPFDPMFSWEIAGVAGTISLIVGVLFGLYPAIRAARKDPINALRQYD